MLGLSVGVFGRIEEGHVHRAGADRGHRDAALAELLRGRPREMLDRRVRAGIGGIKGCVSAEERGDQRADLAVVVEMLACLTLCRRGDPIAAARCFLC